MNGQGFRGGVKRTQKDYSLAFKLGVVEEVEKGEFSYKEAQRKYGIQGRSTVLMWLRKHGRLDWRSTMTKKPTPGKRIRELERALKRAQEDKEILQKAIDIAEEQLGIDIRKKYLAQLSDIMDNQRRDTELGA
jgi:transposase-like protein